MLIQFKVTNFRSIRETQTLSMVARPAKEHIETHTCPSGVKEPGRLVRSAIIYGPNAAGKTNVLRALQFMQMLVVNSAAAPPAAENPYDPFKLSSVTRQSPSEFEISFMQEGTLYEYGFTLTSERIHEEWLIEYPVNRGRRIFTRRYDKKCDQYDWTFSPLFRGNRLLWRDSTRSNALFLSTAAQLNSVQLLPVSAWFQRRLVIVTNIAGFNAGLTLRLLDTPEGKDRLLPFLREADPGIADVDVQREPMASLSSMPGLGVGTMTLQGMGSPPFIVERSAPGSAPTVVRVNFTHDMLEGNEAVKFDLTQESSGTQALFVTAGAWLNVLQNGEVLLFDELDTSLHPLLTRFLIQQFHSDVTNPNCAQLICSTHDTALLNVSLFRRDQVWFVEKGKDWSTRLFPLTEFSPRSDESLERSYLRGRYGAIPILEEADIQ